MSDETPTVCVGSRDEGRSQVPQVFHPAARPDAGLLSGGTGSRDRKTRCSRLSTSYDPEPKPGHQRGNLQDYIGWQCLEYMASRYPKRGPFRAQGLARITCRVGQM